MKARLTHSMLWKAILLTALAALLAGCGEVQRASDSADGSSTATAMPKAAASVPSNERAITPVGDSRCQLVINMTQGMSSTMCDVQAADGAICEVLVYDGGQSLSCQGEAATWTMGNRRVSPGR